MFRFIIRYMIMFFILFITLTCMTKEVLAGNIYLKSSNKAILKGWISYKSLFSKKIGKMSNTSFNINSSRYYLKNKQNNWNLNSKGFVRIGFVFINPRAGTMSNITVDSWPGNFNLILAYIKQNLGNNYYIIVGKDWSLVEQHTFSSYCFVPFPAGFQGSKRFSQVQLMKQIYYKNTVIAPKIAIEYRPDKNGVVIMKNISKANGSVISDSNIINARKSIPAIAINLSLLFAKGFLPLSRIYGFFEVQPIYLFYNGSEHKENPCVVGGGVNINLPFNVSIASEYIHAIGMVGVSGIMGNNFKTYSYVYHNGKLIKRSSDAFNIEAKLRLSKNFAVSAGLDSVSFSNMNYSDSFFLKNEVKKVATAFTMINYRLTRVSKIFAEFKNIKTKYSIGNGNFEEAIGKQYWIGYRYFF